IDNDGEFHQISDGIIQIENEYYSNVRPKQITESGERPSEALKKRGVRYVELRSVDLNPFDPAGINKQQLYFLEAFMVFCLLADSPALSSDDKACVDRNLTLVASEGRKPNLQLSRNKHLISLKNWGLELCEQMIELCKILDSGDKNKPYTTSLNMQIAKLNDVDLTPSALVIHSMKEQGLPFFKFAMEKAKEHHIYFNDHQLTQEQQTFFDQASQASIMKQQQIEQSDTTGFDEFLQHYFSQG
ncbi:MAG: glutamate--cysteine ligase, partial [Cycloclasticus sp.]